MSGDKQHYIPRSLLRGFTHRVGKDGSVLVIRRDKRYVSNINDVAAERHFYGVPGAGSLDDLITDFEGRFGKFFHDLRMQSRSAPLNARMIAKMLAHLSLRSMAIRSTQAKMMVDFLRGFEDFGASESSVGSALDQFMSDDRWLRNLIKKEADRSGARIDERQLKKLVFQARQKFRNERQDFVEDLGLVVKDGAAQMLSRVSVSVKDAQYRLLASFGERSANLIRGFEMLKWELVWCPKSNLN